MKINFWHKEKKQDEWPEGIPKPYEQGSIKALGDFIHGDKLEERHEQMRRQRREWIKKYLGIKDGFPWED